MGKCVHRLNLDLIANFAHELRQADIFAHRRHAIVAGSGCALLTDVLANLCGDILAHLFRLCHLLFCTQWHFFLIANFSRDLSAVVPGHQHANVALHVFSHIVADILGFVAALGHSHRVARLHRDNCAHILLERHLNVLAEGRRFEGALLFLFFPGDIFDHPSLHLLALLPDDVGAHVLVDLLAHVADHPPALLHLLRGAHLGGCHLGHLVADVLRHLGAHLLLLPLDHLLRLHFANFLHFLPCDLSAFAVVPISAIVVVIVVMSTMISIPLTIAVVSLGRFFSVERSFRRSIGIDVVVIAIFAIIAIIGQRGLGWSIRVNITDVTIVTVAVAVIFAVDVVAITDCLDNIKKDIFANLLLDSLDVLLGHRLALVDHLLLALLHLHLLVHHPAHALHKRVTLSAVLWHVCPHLHQHALCIVNIFALLNGTKNVLGPNNSFGNLLAHFFRLSSTLLLSSL